MFDNSLEFACHEILRKKLDKDAYFVNPYAPWIR